MEFIPDFAVPSWKGLDFFPVFDDDEFVESRIEERQDGGGGGEGEGGEVVMADVLFAKNDAQFLSGRNDDAVLLAFEQEPEVAAAAGNGSRVSERTLSSSRV